MCGTCGECKVVKEIAVKMKKPAAATKKNVPLTFSSCFHLKHRTIEEWKYTALPQQSFKMS